MRHHKRSRILFEETGVMRFSLSTSLLRVRWIAATLLVGGLIACSYLLLLPNTEAEQLMSAAEPVKVQPQILFEHWPQEGDKGVKKPDFALVITGQMYG